MKKNLKKEVSKAANKGGKVARGGKKGCRKKESRRLRALSLFANIGVAEAYLKEIGIDVVVANEYVKNRAELYQQIYPDCNMICGDITSEEIFEKIIENARESEIDIIMATPPCQGMSTAGRQEDDDERNKLILPTLRMVQELQPKYVFIENVPLFYQTEIDHNDERISIPNLILQEVGNLYEITFNVLNTADYGVPQTRDRAITLMRRLDVNERKWELPLKETRQCTLRDVIGHLPMLDPFISDVSEEELLEIFPHYYERREAAKKISPWHTPPVHIQRQVVAMQHTPTGCTAFDNEIYFPIKADGTPVRGYKNTYKRQNWDTPAYTITMDNRKISSQNNVHPGRLEYINEQGEEIYSDARTLTTYELMLASSLPKDWPVPLSTREARLRRLIGEGIPPLFVKKIFESLVR
jgi:DNA (cytosine-5)-methyltransferase 1